MGRGNGRGRGRARGGGSPRGNGARGNRRGAQGFSGAKGGAPGAPGSSFLEEELNFTLKMYADAPSGLASPSRRGGRGGRGRGGRGGAQFSAPNSGSVTPNRGRGRGADLPRGRGRGQPDYRPGGRRSDIGIGASPRGRGAGGPPRRPDTLSGLLYQERPLLRPIIFVPSVLTKILFKEDDEEILKPGVEDVDETEQSHLPTADKVFRVFSGGNIPRIDSESEDENEEEDENKEEIEEVDFNEVDKLFNASETIKTTTVRKSVIIQTAAMSEQRFTGFRFDSDAATVRTSGHQQQEKMKKDVDDDVDQLAKMVDETLSATDEVPLSSDVAMSPPQAEGVNPPSSVFSPPSAQAAPVADDASSSLFFVDTEPTPIPAEKAPPSTLLPPSLQDDDSDDVIVYVAPHPRKTDVGQEHLEDTPHVMGDTSHFSPYVSSAVLPDLAANTPTAGPSAVPRMPTPPSLSSFSFSFTGTPARTPSTSTARLVVPPVSTPRQAKAWKMKRGLAVGKGGKSKIAKHGRTFKSSFGAFGVMREEAMLHPLSGPDPRKSERRRGDSDLEWGDEEDDGESVDEVEEGLQELIGRKDKEKGKEEGGHMNMEVDIDVEVSATTTKRSRDKGKTKALDVDNLLHGEVSAGHGMDVDSDIAQPDLDAMKRFAGGLLGKHAGAYVTMEDVDIEERIRREDDEEDEDEDHSSSLDEEEEEEDVVAAEEALLISEALEFDDSEDDDDDDRGPVGVVFSEDESDEDEDEDVSEDDDDIDLTPRSSFQARLERLRKKSREKKAINTSFEGQGVPGDLEEDDDEDDSDEDRGKFLKRNMTLAEQDDDFIQQIQDLLDENEDILTGRDRKTRKALFRSIRDGDFEDLDEFDYKPARRKRDKGKDLPSDLRAQWEKDRQKKAEYKKARAAARLEEAADPMTKKKGGKKGRKAMLAAASLDPTLTVLPNRIIDMTTLVQQIRRFIANLGGPTSMSLPPTNKETRKNVHEMAVAFGLKSVSKGKGDARYTTLSKTTRSGVHVDERKVAKIVRRAGGMGARGDSFVYDKKGKGPPTRMPRHKEGEVVGQAAPKLTESNVGFRMLAMMGWSEGDRIGFTGGLDAPLTAVIKHTKLGLGAMK